MKKASLLSAFICMIALSATAQQRVFDWSKASDEAVELDPADYHTGRVYHAEPGGGNLHVGIEARQSVTIALAWSDEWSAALQHRELMRNMEWRCMREHVVSTIYEC